MPRRMFGKKIDEAKWSAAKAQASKEGKAGNYAYITSIYKKMAHASKAVEFFTPLAILLKTWSPQARRAAIEARKRKANPKKEVGNEAEIERMADEEQNDTEQEYMANPTRKNKARLEKLYSQQRSAKKSLEILSAIELRKAMMK
jgi:hypothetical protein